MERDRQFFKQQKLYLLVSLFIFGVQWSNAEVPIVVDLFDSGNKMAQQLEEHFWRPFLEAIQSFHESTCIRFRSKRSLDKQFVRVFTGRGFKTIL